MNIDKLHNHWEHSIEEDTDREMVFRPASYKFPMRRGGRGAIELRADGTFTQRGNVLGGENSLGPDDRYSYSEGKWDVDDDGNLRMQGGVGDEDIKLRILEASGEKLVIQK